MTDFSASPNFALVHFWSPLWRAGIWDANIASKAKIKHQSGAVFGAGVKMLSFIMVPGSEFWLHPQFQLPAPEHPGRKQVMANAWLSGTHVGELDRVPNSQLLSGSALAIASIWDVNQWTRALFVTLSCLGFSNE